MGDTAPQLRFVHTDKSNGDLASLKGEVVVLLSVPSLDTSTCASQTRRFNVEAADLGAHVLVVSMDLHYAMRRFCETEGITNVQGVSDFRFQDLSRGWKAAFAEGPMQGLTCRAVWVIDRAGVIRYHELVAELGQEPDHRAALNAAKALL